MTIEAAKNAFSPPWQLVALQNSAAERARNEISTTAAHQSIAQSWRKPWARRICAPLSPVRRQQNRESPLSAASQLPEQERHAVVAVKHQDVKASWWWLLVRRGRRASSLYTQRLLHFRPCGLETPASAILSVLARLMGPSYRCAEAAVARRAA